MQDFSKGHIDIYRDFEDFYKGLINKADRIHHAICLVSKYALHKDTSNRLDSIGIDFIEMSYMLHPMFAEDRTLLSTQISYTLRELKTLTQGLVIKGIFSRESKELFDREIDTFNEVLQDYLNTEREREMEQSQGIISPLFDAQFFGEALKPLVPKIEEKKSPHISRTQTPLKGHETDMSFKKKPEEISKGHTVKDTEDKGQTQSKKKTDAVDRLNRKSAILNFIKQNKEARIKDILTHIGDCSEKTIQRELNELIRDGVLKKEGDRRWSKYSLLKDIR